MMNRERFKITVLFLAFVLICGLFIPIYFAQAQGVAQPASVSRPKIEYKAGELRDPFKSPISELPPPEEKPPVVVETPPPQFTVQGVIWGGSFPQAIINNKVVKAGDTLEGATIKSIAKDGIIIIFNKKEYKISSPAGAGGSSQNP